MLSYQHIYHAGCNADVHKHSALALILAALVAADKTPLCFVETHAGRGAYDLASAEAKKTGEAKTGVMRLAGKELPPPLMAYLRAVTKKRGEYPGSPLIAARLLRPQDRLHLCELHPREYEALVQNMGGDKRASFYKADGYQTALDIAQQAPGRGLVLIDPSYEIKDEYTQVADFSAALHRAWPEAVILLWAPLLAAGRHEVLTAALEHSHGAALWRDEAHFAAPGSVRGMYGSLLAGLNIPEAVKDDLALSGNWCAEHCRP